MSPYQSAYELWLALSEPSTRPKAVRALRKRAVSGDADAQWHLAEYLINRPRNYDARAAFALYLEAARTGHTAAQVSVGYLYETRNWAKRDFRAACAYYRKAAAKGDALASSNLAMNYEMGRGVAKNLRFARKGYLDAAVNDPMVWKAAEFLLFGVGGPRNYKRALQLLRKGARVMKCAECQLYLGLAYQRGLGVEANRDTALRWYRRAAFNPSGASEQAGDASAHALLAFYGSEARSHISAAVACNVPLGLGLCGLEALCDEGNRRQSRRLATRLLRQAESSLRAWRVPAHPWRATEVETNQTLRRLRNLL